MIVINSYINQVNEGISSEIAKSKSTFRITNGTKNGNKISFKMYESGWAGGSRAKIKTYKIAPIAKGFSKYFSALDKAFMFVELKNGYDAKKIIL